MVDCRRNYFLGVVLPIIMVLNIAHTLDRNIGHHKLTEHLQGPRYLGVAQLLSFELLWYCNGLTELICFLLPVPMHS
jgi:hypothetical protein